MKNFKSSFVLPFFLFLLIVNCASLQKKYSKENFHAIGRVEQITDTQFYLIGSASAIGFTFNGKNAEVLLQSKDSWQHHNYFCLEIDGVYKGRFKIEKGDAQKFNINAETNKVHFVKIYKATEAANGSILIDLSNINSVIKSAVVKKKKIEFIGNSITSGMGNDLSIPCGTGDWFDQHNAYFSYASILARKLDADYLLSSVSGIGMYRNWNDEHENEAIMPEVYQNLYLNKDSSKPFSSEFQPDLVSICLGTNDLSDGDGKKTRLPFNEEKYLNNYIAFIKNIYQKYPKTRIALLTSPMVSGERNVIFVNALKKVTKAFEKDQLHKPIILFEYLPMTPKGCGYHPDINDHRAMAAQLESTFKKLLND